MVAQLSSFVSLKVTDLTDAPWRYFSSIINTWLVKTTMGKSGSISLLCTVLPFVFEKKKIFKKKLDQDFLQGSIHSLHIIDCRHRRRFSLQKILLLLSKGSEGLDRDGLWFVFFSFSYSHLTFREGWLFFLHQEVDVSLSKMGSWPVF